MIYIWPRMKMSDIEGRTCISHLLFCDMMLLLKELCVAVVFLPQLALEGGHLAVHGVCRLRGVLQLPLEFPSVGVGPLGLLLSLLQLALQLLHARVQLVRLEKRNELW